ncbi:DAGKc domain-containing protein [Aphelenchoides fujianensis]|nr:DAGKc domain-containing protein [Aphelenchoides fujianensis]
MRVVYELKRTEHANHAVELMQQLDLDDYAAVAVLSGDGLIAEVLRGLLTRADDRDRALRFPILHVPCGTSNALAGAVCFKSREPFSPRDDFSRELALMIACPVYRGLRLQHVQTAHDGDWLMFMTAAWGLIADIDLGSERFRALGLIRLHVEAFIRIAQLPTMARYKGRVSYKPVNDKQLLRNTLLKAEEAWRELGAAHFALGRVELFEGDGDVGSGGSTEKPIRSVAEAFEGTHVGGETPALSSPVPSDWITMEGEFVFVCCSALSHLGSDLPYIPSARMEEEVFYLTFIDWRTLKSRFHMGHLLITVDRCTHLDHTCLHMLPVTACRIEPAAGAGGFIAIDGEPVTSGAPFQVTSTPLQATVIARDNQR